MAGRIKGTGWRNPFFDWSQVMGRAWERAFEWVRLLSHSNSGYDCGCVCCVCVHARMNVCFVTVTFHYSIKLRILERQKIKNEQKSTTTLHMPAYHYTSKMPIPSSNDLYNNKLPSVILPSNT